MKFSRLLAFVVLAAFLAACGGKSGEQQASEEIRTITMIGLDGMRFAVEGDTVGITVSDTLGANQELRRLETITVKPGERIEIVLITRSQLPPVAMAHNWVLLALNTDADAFAREAIQAKANEYLPPGRSDEVLASTGLAAGGETERVTFTAPETPGEYDYICSFPGHYSAGMRGKLIVEE